MSFLTMKKYPIDTTGESQDNRVASEKHIVSPSYNVIVPIHAPFFQESLIVRYGGTRLTPGTDFQFSDLDEDATRASNKSVYTMIVLKRQDIQGEIILDYQTYGDVNYAGVLAKYIELILKDNRGIDWKNIFNKPEAYPPIYHGHHVKDLRGIWPIVIELQEIKKAIEFLRYKGNMKLRGEIFNHIAALNEKFDRFRDVVDKSIDLAEMKREIINNLSTIVGSPQTLFEESKTTTFIGSILDLPIIGNLTNVGKEGLEHYFVLNNSGAQTSTRTFMEALSNLFVAKGFDHPQVKSFLASADDTAKVSAYSRTVGFDRETFNGFFRQEFYLRVLKGAEELFVSAERYFGKTKIGSVTKEWVISVLKNTIADKVERANLKREILSEVSSTTAREVNARLNERLSNFTISWTNITNKPTFTTAWGEITDKPSLYPTRWDMVTNKPNMDDYASWRVLLAKEHVVNGDYTTRLNKEVVVTAQTNLSEVMSTNANYDILFTNVKNDVPEYNVGKSVLLKSFGTTQKSNHRMLIDVVRGVIYFKYSGSFVPMKLDYSYIGNKPQFFPTHWDQIEGKPANLQVAAVTWDNLTGKPSTFPTTWNDIQDKPTKFSTTWNDVSGKPTTFPSSWNDISGKPTSFPVSWATITDKPSSFPVNWNDIRGKPVIPSGIVSWPEITNKPQTFPTNWNNVESKPNWLNETRNNHDFLEPEFKLESNRKHYQLRLPELFSSTVGVVKCWTMSLVGFGIDGEGGYGIQLKDCFIPLDTTPYGRRICHVKAIKLHDGDYGHILLISGYLMMENGSDADSYFTREYKSSIRKIDKVYTSVGAFRGVESIVFVEGSRAHHYFLSDKDQQPIVGVRVEGRDNQMIDTINRLTW